MRTAKTHYFLKGELKSCDFKTRADIQRRAFNEIGANWPKDVDEVHFQLNDGPLKIRSKEKAEAVAKQLVDSQKHAAGKAAIAQERAEEAKAKQVAEAEAKKKAADEARAREVKAKEDAKKPAVKPVK